MMVAPLLCGFLLGAILGVLVTDLRQHDLVDQARYAFARFRLVQVRDRTINTDKPRSGVTQIVWAAGRVLRLEWVILLSVVWLLLAILWIGASSGLSVGNSDWLGNSLIGSLVGFGAAPWVWLHFSRDFLTDAQRNDADTDKIRAEYLARYRLLTIILGIALLSLAAGPKLLDLLKSAEKVDLFGVSVSISQGSTRQTSSFPLLPSTPPGGLAIDTLNQNTYQAAQVFNGQPLSAIPADLEKFDDLDKWDRDRAFIAYLVHSRSRHLFRPTRTRVDNYDNLSAYIAAAEAIEPLSDGAKRDLDFLSGTSHLFNCLYDYARMITDIHLYFLDTSEFLKQYSIVLKLSLADHPQAATASLDTSLSHLETASDKLLSRVNEVRYLFPPESRNLHILGSCDSQWPWHADPAGPWPFSAPSGATPYPALLAAYSLAAVDSPETGIVYIADWIDHANSKRASPSQATLAQRWYLERAKIELALMASTSIRPLLQTERLVILERKLTNDFGTLLDVTTPKSWTQLCADLEGGGLHAAIGRRLAFYYATARNYLFELQTPAAVQIWNQPGQPDLIRFFDDDLVEAARLADTAADCFRGVPLFERRRAQWIGQFKLNVAQLHIAHATLAAGDLSAERKEAERKEIEGLLNDALNLLGPIQVNAGVQRLDNQLLESDGFDDQRARVWSLKALISNLGKST
jgi:hypothetical protein